MLIAVRYSQEGIVLGIYSTKLLRYLVGKEMLARG